MHSLESHLQLLPLQTVNQWILPMEVLHPNNATQVCKSQIPFRLCHIAQGLEMRTLDFLVIWSGERALCCLKAEKLDGFFPQCCLLVIKGMCTGIKEVTGITLCTWRCMSQLQSF